MEMENISDSGKDTPEFPVALSVDCRGKHCPMPVAMLKKGLSQVQVGEILEVIATDPATERDIPPAARNLGSEVLKQWVIDKPYVSKTGKKYDKEYRYYIRRLE